MTKPLGKMDHYKNRLRSRKHLQNARFSFAGIYKDILKIVKCFGESQAEYYDAADKLKYFPVLNCKAIEVAADFKYCYEIITESVYNQYGRDEWDKLYKLFEENRINEFYESITPDANLSYIYNFPTYLIFKREISAPAFRVLCAFIARAKRIPQLGGIKICGWSAQKLGKEIGLHRNTVSKCIKELEAEGHLTLIASMSNERSKTYSVKI